MANGWITSHSNFVAIDGWFLRIMGGTKYDLYTITTPAYTDTDMMVEYAKLMKEWDNIRCMEDRRIKQYRFLKP